MTNTRTTKRALLTSTMALFLCFAMLLGTTYAWFTDSVTSANNIIKSGNLDIELYHKDGNLTKEEKVDSTTKLFDDIALWEPGAVVYETFRVANEGDLALKYQLSVNVTDATENANGDTLADVLKVGVIEDGTKEVDRKNMIGEVKEWKSLETFTLHDNLAAEKDKTYTVVIYWEPSENDNDYNMNNNAGQTLLLNIGVTLLATQYTAENDSFNNKYDEDAWMDGMFVYSESELNAAIANGTNVVLGADVELQSSVTVDEGMVVNINLNGKKLSANLTTTEGAVLINNGTATISNGTIASMAVNGSEAVVNNGTMVLGDVTIYGAPMDTTGYPAYAVGTSGKLTIEEGTKVYADRGAIRTSDGAELIINDGEFIVSDAADGRNMMNHVVYAYGKNTTVIIRGGYFEYNHTSTGGASVVCPYYATIEVYGGDFRDAMDDSNWTSVGNFQNYMGTKDPVVYGGTYDDNTVLKHVADGYTAAENNGVYYVVPKSEVGGAAAVVANDAELAAAIQDANNTIIYLMGGEYGVVDVTVNRALTLQAMEGEVVKLAGVDGQSNGKPDANITIKNITIDNALQTEGWFTGTAQNIKPCVGVWGGDYTFENCTFFVTGESGAETGVMSWWTTEQGTMTFKGCTFNGGNGSARGMQIYGNYNLNVEDCTFTTAKDYAIKYVGAEGCKATLEGNKVYNTVNFVQAGSGAYPGKNYTIEFKNNILADGINHVFVDNDENQTIFVNGNRWVGTAKQLATAVADGATNIYLLPGEYDVYGCGGKTLTINGSKNAVIKLYNDGEDGCDYAFGGNGTGVGNVTFNGITIDTTSNTGNYKGFAYMKGTFNDCNFVGAYSLNNANDFVFNRCTFDFKNGYFWTWGAKSVTFNACTFNGNSKTILAHGYASTVININNCIFAATEKGYTGAGDHTAVVEIDPAGDNRYTINFTGNNTKTENYSGWTRVKDGTEGHAIPNPTSVDSAEKAQEALTAGKNVEMADDISVDTIEKNSNGYGKTGVNMTGGVFDGKDNTLSVPAANSTWDSAISTNGGIIQNLTIDAGFRGIFVRAGGSKVYLDNVTIDGSVYTISCDSASGHGLEATNSTFNGWTSYAGTIGNVKFTDCNFGEGAGYAFCRPYAPTEFVNCNFEAGFVIDARAAITLENCYLDGVLITAENIATLVVYNTGNAQVK